MGRLKAIKNLLVILHIRKLKLKQDLIIYIVIHSKINTKRAKIRIPRLKGLNLKKQLRID